MTDKPPFELPATPSPPSPAPASPVTAPPVTGDDRATPQQSAARHVRGERPRALPKRFYQLVTVDAAPTPPDVRILLDGRPIRTPAKRELAVPGEALAEAIAAEWRAQLTTIDPATMPLTKLVNTAIDGVRGREAEVRADIVGYAGSDLVCYLASAPADLVASQQERWGPVRDWFGDHVGVELRWTQSIQHVEQDELLATRLDAVMSAYGAFELAALHVITTLTGSAVLALACAERRLTVAQAWALAHIDEDFQIAMWGEDAEAAQRRSARTVDVDAASRLLELSGEALQIR